MGILGVFLFTFIAITLSNDIEEDLKLIQAKLLQDFSLSSDWGLDIEGITYRHMLRLNIEKKFAKYVGNEPIFVYEAISRSDHALGNRFGNYFEALSCADAANMHFVCIPHHHHSQNNFSKGLPSVIIHENPAKNSDEAIKNLKMRCRPEPFPWVTSTSHMYRNINKVSKYFSDAVAAHINVSYSNKIPPTVSNTTFSQIKLPKHLELLANSDSFELPLVPSAAVVVRCVDILSLTSAVHGDVGFTNWNVFASLIPQDAKEIYILTEPLNYSGNEFLLKLHISGCLQFAQHLLSFLVDHFPHAIVALRRGHPDDSMVALARAETVICSTTTFCLFPSSARIGLNKLYQQKSKLLPFDSNNRSLSNYISWVVKPDIIYFEERDIRNSEAVEEYIYRLSVPAEVELVN